jgi:hypothetical protein
MGVVSKKWTKLTELISNDAIALLAARGTKLVEKIGIDIVRSVVFDVLVGKNLRDSTESLTRKRIATLNLALLRMFMTAADKEGSIEELLTFAHERLTTGEVTKEERWLAQWILGLTDKAFQNVLRDERVAINRYLGQYKKTCQQIVADFENSYGAVCGSLAMGPDIKAEINSLFLVYFLNAIGSETLTIRGSEKSAYGKLFEKLILGSLLSILGFEFVDAASPRKLRKVFWLAQQGERRESDATLLYTAGKGIRFDIGFIGRGNPEISLDKVTRFEREIQLGRKKWYLATIIIVDRIGKNSRIEKLADRVGGTIVQMSMSYWPRQVAAELKRILGYSSEMLGVPDAKISEYIRCRLLKVPLEPFIGLQKQH